MTLITVAATYCGPDAYNGAYEDLINRARSPEADGDEIRALKAELKEALANPAQLPADELSVAVEYSDGNDEAFLRRLWHDLYSGEPAPVPDAGKDS
jgi:hypothetical protein